MPMTEQEAQAMLDWIHGAPRAVQRLMAQIPPGATVRSRENFELDVPAPGEVAYVLGYDSNGGSPFVLVHDGADMTGYCLPEWLEVVEYCYDIDGTFVRAVCGLEEPC